MTSQAIRAVEHPKPRPRIPPKPKQPALDSDTLKSALNDSSTASSEPNENKTNSASNDEGDLRTSANLSRFSELLKQFNNATTTYSSSSGVTRRETFEAGDGTTGLPPRGGGTSKTNPYGTLPRTRATLETPAIRKHISRAFGLDPNDPNLTDSIGERLVTKPIAARRDSLGGLGSGAVPVAAPRRRVSLGVLLPTQDAGSSSDKGSHPGETKESSTSGVATQASKTPSSVILANVKVVDAETGVSTTDVVRSHANHMGAGDPWELLRPNSVTGSGESRQLSSLATLTVSNDFVPFRIPSFGEFRCSMRGSKLGVCKNSSTDNLPCKEIASQCDKEVKRSHEKVAVDVPEYSDFNSMQIGEGRIDTHKPVPPAEKLSEASRTLRGTRNRGSTRRQTEELVGSDTVQRNSHRQLSDPGRILQKDISTYCEKHSEKNSEKYSSVNRTIKEVDDCHEGLNRTIQGSDALSESESRKARRANRRSNLMMTSNVENVTQSGSERASNDSIVVYSDLKTDQTDQGVKRYKHIGVSKTSLIKNHPDGNNSMKISGQVKSNIGISKVKSDTKELVLTLDASETRFAEKNVDRVVPNMHSDMIEADSKIAQNDKVFLNAKQAVERVKKENVHSKITVSTEGRNQGKGVHRRLPLPVFDSPDNILANNGFSQTLDPYSELRLADCSDQKQRSIKQSSVRKKRNPSGSQTSLDQIGLQAEQSSPHFGAHRLKADFGSQTGLNRFKQEENTTPAKTRRLKPDFGSLESGLNKIKPASLLKTYSPSVIARIQLANSLLKSCSTSQLVKLLRGKNTSETPPSPDLIKKLASLRSTKVKVVEREVEEWRMPERMERQSMTSSIKQRKNSEQQLDLSTRPKPRPSSASSATEAIRPDDVTLTAVHQTAIWLSRDGDEDDAILEYNPGIWDFLNIGETSTNQELLELDAALQPCDDCGADFDPAELCPSASDPGHMVCRKCFGKARERMQAAREIVDTEARYGNDLRILRDEFYTPLRSNSLLTDEQLHSVFLNLDELITINDFFRRRLEAGPSALQGDKAVAVLITYETYCPGHILQNVQFFRGDKAGGSVSSPYGDVGRAFLDAANMLMAYETYCAGHAASGALMERLTQERELLRVFLDQSQQENPALRKMPLKSFLIAPVQRVMKYPLLLDRLLKATPSYHADKDNLTLAKQRIEDTLALINSRTVGSMRVKRGSTVSTWIGRMSVGFDSENASLTQAALDQLRWSRHEMYVVLVGVLQSAQLPWNRWTAKEAPGYKYQPLHCVLVTLGMMPNYGSPMAAVGGRGGEPLLFPQNSTLRAAALVTLRELRPGKYAPVREPLQLERCVVAMETGLSAIFDIQEMNKEQLLLTVILVFAIAEDAKQAVIWFWTLRMLAKDLGRWRRRRPAVANAMTHRRDESYC